MTDINESNLLFNKLNILYELNTLNYNNLDTSNSINNTSDMFKLLSKEYIDGTKDLKTIYIMNLNNTILLHSIIKTEQGEYTQKIYELKK